MSYDNESDCGGDDNADEIDNNDYYMFYMLYIYIKVWGAGCASRQVF